MTQEVRRRVRCLAALGAVACLSILALAADAGAYIYWANININRTIGRANLDGTGVNQSFVTVTHTPDQRPCGVAVDDGHIYWGNFARFDPQFTIDSSIGRANLDGSGANQSFITGAHGPCGVAVADGHIYWANYGGIGFSPGTTIGRANLDGSGVNQSFITGANAPCGVAVNAANVYWANSGWTPSYAFGTTIGRANLDGSGANQSFITGAGGPSGLALDANHLYWTNSGFPPSSVGRANLDGSGVDQSFVNASANPNGVAVDAGAPSNGFAFGKTKLNKDRGIAYLRVKVPGSGKVTLRGKGIKPVKRQGAARSGGIAKPVKEAGTVKLKVEAKGKARVKLLRTGKATVVAKVTFDPDGADPSTQKRKVTLRRRT